MTSPTLIGARMASTSRRATAMATRSAVSGHSSTNSSPPVRATVSPLRVMRRSRSATTRSTSSPMAWPCVSFTSLNPSRSSNSTDTSFCGSRRDTAASRRACSKMRLPRPVSGSWSACPASCSSRRLRSVMSRTLTRNSTASPVTGSTTVEAELATHTDDPSARIILISDVSVPTSSSFGAVRTSRSRSAGCTIEPEWRPTSSSDVKPSSSRHEGDA